MKVFFVFLLLFVSTIQAHSWKVQDLGTLSSELSFATSINQEGEVAGILFQEGKYFFKWSPGRNYMLIKAPDDNPHWNYGMGPFINHKGRISEFPIDGESNTYQIIEGILYKISLQGSVEILDDSLFWLNPQTSFNDYTNDIRNHTDESQVFRVNKSGMVLGRTKSGIAIYDPSSKVKITLLPQKIPNRKQGLMGASYINDKGEVTCWAEENRMWDAGGYNGHIWDKKNGYKYDLVDRIAHLINNKDLIISYRDEKYGKFGWELDVDFDDKWIAIGGLTDINDHGQIVGWGITKNGKIHAILLNLE